MDQNSRPVTPEFFPSRWQFTDDKGATWNGTVHVEAVAGERNRFQLSVKIGRTNASAREKSE